MADLDTLLTLQGHDTALAQLHHRRSHLPEQAELADIERQVTALEADTAPVRAAHDALVAKESALEHQVGDIETKVAEVSARMYSGTVTAPRELQSMEADIASLKKRRSELEDTELALMEEREPIDAQLAAAMERRNGLDARAAALRVAITEAQIVIDAEAQHHGAERSATAALVPADLLATYERIRAKNRGVGIARLEHGTCMSCGLKLPAVELDRIKSLPADSAPSCEECGAILVRP